WTVRDLGTALDRRYPVEHHGVRTADDDLVAGLRTCLDQRLLDAQPVESIGEVADGFVIGEVGLVHPALGLGTTDPEPDALVGDREPGVVDGGWTQHQPGPLGRRRSVAGGL